jgi:CheY-like chemotaxis protein
MGETAIEKARQSDPDLLICDLNLLGRSGMELWDSIRQERQGEPLPAMFLSATQAPDVIRRSEGAVGTYYLRKPFDPDVLLALVEQALAPQRSARCHSSPQPASV